MTVARRWRILRDFVLKSKMETDTTIREISTFGMIKSRNCDEQNADECFAIVEYTISPHQLLYLRQRKESSISLDDIKRAQVDKVDSTGAVCMWVSEEVMAYWILTSYDRLIPANRHTTTVLELGAGFGIAGFALWQYHHMFKENRGQMLNVILSDGNKGVVDALQHNVNHFNEYNPGLKDHGESGRITARQMLWQNETQYSDIVGAVDVALGADCLFFEDFHKDLITLLYKVLNRCVDSRAIMFAPRRGGSLERFLELLESQNQARISQGLDALVWTLEKRYDDKVWRKHEELQQSRSDSYRPDIHFPLKLELRWNTL